MRHITRSPEGSRTARRGFALIEAIVSAVLIAGILAALTAMFSLVLRTSGSQPTQQNANRLAASTLDVARSVGYDRVLLGRGQTSVTEQFQDAAALTKTHLSGGVASLAYDTDAPPGAGANQCQNGEVAGCALLPTRGVTTIVDGTTFTVGTYTQWCTVPAGISTGTACTPGEPTGSGIALIRVVADVTWHDGTCGPGGCHRTLSALIGPGGD